MLCWNACQPASTAWIQNITSFGHRQLGKKTYSCDVCECVCLIIKEKCVWPRGKISIANDMTHDGLGKVGECSGYKRASLVIQSPAPFCYTWNRLSSTTKAFTDQHLEMFHYQTEKSSVVYYTKTNLLNNNKNSK